MEFFKHVLCGSLQALCLQCTKLASLPDIPVAVPFLCDIPDLLQLVQVLQTTKHNLLSSNVTVLHQCYVNILSLVLVHTFSRVRMLMEGACSILKNLSPSRLVLSSCFRVSSWLRCSAICFKAKSVLSALLNGPGYANVKT